MLPTTKLTAGKPKLCEECRQELLEIAASKQAQREPLYGQGT
jgi:hypothetical protein